MNLGKIFRKVYDATSDSRSSFGKIGKWAFPFNSQYLVRDGWRSIRKKLVPKVNSASSYGASSPSVYGYTGSIVGKY